MEISRKTDYALRMLAELVREPDAVISVRAAAERNDVPYSFARSVQHDLVKVGIVESLRGSRGGMRLAKDPRAMTLLEVVESVQGPVSIASCESGAAGSPCPRKSACNFNAVWCGANRILRAYLASVTLYDVVIDGKRPSLPEDLPVPGGSDRQ